MVLDNGKGTSQNIKLDFQKKKNALKFVVYNLQVQLGLGNWSRCDSF